MHDPGNFPYPSVPPGKTLWDNGAVFQMQALDLHIGSAQKGSSFTKT